MGRDAKINKVEGKITFADGRETTFTLFESSGDWSWQQGANDAHILGERATGDILDGLMETVREHQEDNLPSEHWHVGSHVPGYLPEGDVLCFDTPAEAKEALHQQLTTAQDALPGCELPPVDEGSTCGSCGSCTAWTDIAVVLDRWDEVDVSDGFSLDVHDGRELPVRYVVERVPAHTCEIEDEN